MSNKVRILIVDDAKFTRDLIAKTLRTSFGNIEIEEAPNGRKAQGLLSRHSYDLVLCDWEMPEMSGVELLEWVRADDSRKSLPFILVTAQGGKEHVMRAVQLGVSDFIGKPFSTEQLLSKVGKQLAKAHKFKLAKGKTHPVYRNTLAENNPLAQFSGSNRAAVTGHLDGHATAAQSRQRKRAVPKGKGQLQWSGQTQQTLIKTITLNEAQLLLKREEGYPSLLAEACLTIALPEGEPALTLHGFVQGLQAVEKRIDTPLVLVQLRFTEPDTAVLERLSRFVTQFG